MAGRPTIIAIASGKGGVGKTNVSLNLAWALARQGRRVCLLDADLGLSNVDLLLGISPERTLEQVLFEGLPLRDAVMPVATGIDLVPGSSGVARMAELTRPQRQRLAREFALLSAYDYVLVDNSPGISPQVLALCLAAQELVLVVNPEITSLTDAYALVKVLHGRGLNWPPLVLVNRAQDEASARLVFRRIQHTAQKHLSLNCGYLGSLPEDPVVGRAAALQRPVLEAFPNSAFARAAAEAARRLSVAAGAGRLRAVDAPSFWDESVRALMQMAPVGPAGAEAPALAETQSMLREVQAMAALFARLNFRGAPEPLRRIAEAGSGHARRLSQALEHFAPAQPPAQAEQAKTYAGRVQVRCPDREMGRIVADILRDMGLEPVALNGGRPPVEGAALCVLAAEEPHAVQGHLRALGGTPLVVLDESFGRSRSAWLATPGVRAVLPVPFRVAELCSSVAEVLRL